MADHIRPAACSIIDTPFLKTLLRFDSQLYLSDAGWRLTGEISDTRRCVMIAAPDRTDYRAP